MATLQTETNKFVQTLQKSDVSKMNSNDALGPKGDKYIATALASGFLNYAPQLISSALSKMKSPALKNFQELYEKEYDKEALSAMGNQPRLDQLAERWKSFENSLAHNALSSAPDTDTQSGAPPSASSSPHP